MMVLFVGLVSALSLGGAARRLVDAVDERVFRLRVMMSNPGQLLRRQEAVKQEEEAEERPMDEDPREEVAKRENEEERSMGESPREEVAKRENEEERSMGESPREEVAKREDEEREEGTAKRRRRRERRRRHEAGAKERASGDAVARQETAEQEARETVAKAERAEAKKSGKRTEKTEAMESGKKSERAETRDTGKKTETGEAKKSEKAEARESRDVKAEEESGVKSWAVRVKRKKDAGAEKEPGKRRRVEAMEYRRVVPVVDAIESEEEVVTLKPFLRAGRQLLKAFRSLGIPKNGNKWAVKGNKANFTISFDECWVSGVEVTYVVDDPCQFVKYYVDGVDGSLVGGNFTFAELTELHSLKLVTENVDTATSTCLWSCEVVCEDTEA